ncbi:uncharacterized protein At5g39865-like [Syzygium oleosum]|uniref:uncharacterized protein At5g39865-like n=1 Tax=Syzygium oleosum TaxID=219896 RepID=UPI0011D19133|nr:uncharacterized protein At5g39865-like [Syzygium oleosum]
MANCDANFDLSAKRRSPPFNRSVTMRAEPAEKPCGGKPSFERAGSVKSIYSSIESFMPTGDSIKGKVRRLRSLFESAKPPSRGGADEAQTVAAHAPSKLKPAKSVDCGYDHGCSFRLPGTEDRIVVYFTSLRGVRRTFEDCYAVRMILRGFRVWVDERDVSMDSAYRKELLSVLGEKNVSLPQVFVGGKYVGGVDVIKQLYEVGELGKILERFPKRAPGFVCDCCGDARFVPCTNCSGSRKVFDEDEGALKRCLECNENGLIRCPDCCS